MVTGLLGFLACLVWPWFLLLSTVSFWGKESFCTPSNLSIPLVSGCLKRWRQEETMAASGSMTEPQYFPTSPEAWKDGAESSSFSRKRGSKSQRPPSSLDHRSAVASKLSEIYSLTEFTGEDQREDCDVCSTLPTGYNQSLPLHRRLSNWHCTDSYTPPLTTFPPNLHGVRIHRISCVHSPKR